MNKSFAFLFLCTGNYYRSRFSEIYFNFLAKERGLNIRALSRGLEVFTARNSGPISIHTKKYLVELEIPIEKPIRTPLQFEENDFELAETIIAIDKSEHYPMMEAQFPNYKDFIEYWLIHDLDQTEPEDALPKLKQKVESLFEKL